MGAPGWVCLPVTQAGCRGLELVALFSPWPCRVQAAALSHRGVVRLAWRLPRHTQPQAQRHWGLSGLPFPQWRCEHFPRCSSVTKGPVPLELPPVRALEELEGDLAPQTQPETLRGTLPLPRLPDQEHLWATVRYYPNCQPRGPLQGLREEETTTPTTDGGTGAEGG